jgi:putative ABC transport system substrate-binding protein
MAIHIGRRKIILALGGAAVAWPLAARAQQSERIRRVGGVDSFLRKRSVYSGERCSFYGGLRRSGWVEGKNIHIDYRFAAGDPKLKTAKALGLTVSNSMQLLADEVIE